MVHYSFNLGSPAANNAPERTGGQYATRLAGQKARSIGVPARQPKARLNRSEVARIGAGPLLHPRFHQTFYGELGGGVGQRRLVHLRH